MVTVASFPLQKALAIATNVAVSAVRHDVMNTHIISPGVQNNTVNTPAIISDSHRNVLKSPEDTRGQNGTVSTIRTLSVAEQPLKINQTHARSAISVV
jgi:hypothetical protein